MEYYALFYEVVDDFVRRRAPYREEHLRLAQEAHTRGDLVLAARWPTPQTEPCSSSGLKAVG